MHKVSSSQAGSHFPLEPIPADILAENEARRRNEARRLGLVKCGCPEVDGYVLQGGLERGGVVGVSAEEEGVGLLLGLQMLAHSLCEGTLEKVMVVTPKPVTWIAGELRDALRREMEIRDAGGIEENSKTSGEEVSGGVEKLSMKDRLRACLDRVMLSQVFDADGLWEALAELDEPLEQAAQVEAQQEAGKAEDITGKEDGPVVLEVQDSQDEDDSPISPASAEESKQRTATVSENPQQSEGLQQQSTRQTPAFILVTHFSTLLNSLFTSREKSAAHSLLQLLSSRLRYLSHGLPSQPLIMLLNSTTANQADDRPQKRDRGEGGPADKGGRKPLDATLRSVFNPPDIPYAQGYVSKAAAEYLRRNKPHFGMVFSQLLDVHLLCTRGEDDAQGQIQDVMVVEVLLDEMGVWEGKIESRKIREQRWGALRVNRGRLVDGLEEGKKVYGDVRIVAGFGGPRV